MTSWRATFSLPLLGKELTEAAARRRTYELRVIYGVLLYGVFVFALPGFSRGGAQNSTALAGEGRRMLEMLVMLQFGAIALFLPALMCGRITGEKERDSLVLLFLTELGPWRIVLEKYLSGLVPMLTFLLLVLPLGAVAYAFGGFALPDLLTSAGLLTLFLLQIGALALACSAWCRTTVGAFFATYLLGLALYFGPLFLHRVAYGFFGSLLAPHFPWQVSGWFFELCHPLAIFSPLAYPQGLRFRSNVLSLFSLGPTVLSIPVLLLLARIGLVRRAFVPPGNFLRRSFRWLDTRMQRANRLVGNVMVLRPRTSLPVNDPIAWREQTRSGLGQPHYLMRILCLIELPVALLCFLVATAMPWSSGYRSEFSALMGLVFGVAALFLCVHSANAFVSERVHQSLDVLLTTPLRAAEIVAQKARALYRLAWLLAVPILTVAVVERIVEFQGWQLRFSRYSRTDETWPYLVCTLLAVLIYLPLILWLSLWIGLRARTRFKAIITALGVLVAWCAGPFAAILLWVMPMNRSLPDQTFEWALLLSPASILLCNESGELHALGGGEHSPWLPLAFNFGCYFLLLLLFRSLALARADRYLRR
jgi:ABC-type transport system involved in multi-copper enzyme maturation permease subunit